MIESIVVLFKGINAMEIKCLTSFYLVGRDLTSPQGIKQVTVTSSGQMTPGGQMRNQFSPGGQPQGWYINN